MLEAIQSVRYTPVDRWIAQEGKDSRFVVKRLKAPSPMTSSGLQKMKAAGRLIVGKPYDGVFGWSDDKIYCSELVWKIYQQGLGIQLSPLKTLKDFDLSSPHGPKKTETTIWSPYPF